MAETSLKKIIINDGGLIISVMDVPTQNTEAEQEDRITDKNIDLQGPSNSSRDGSSWPWGSRDSINGEKE